MSTPVSRLSAVFDYVEENLQAPLSLDGLSRAGGLSPFQLIRLFDRFIGCTPMAYVRERRLARSIPQLLRGDAVLRVALDWGFAYEQSYIRAFQAAFGVTPARFRREGRSARITGVPRLGGFTVSASGMLGRPAMIARPGFALTGVERAYNYKDNLLRGRPLLDGIRDTQGAPYTAACRPSPSAYFEHLYLVRQDGGPAVWSFPAGEWARFDYSGLHPLDEAGAQRVRLLMSLVIGGWFKENALYWDGSFMETVDPGKCSFEYCEVAFLCYLAGRPGVV